MLNMFVRLDINMNWPLCSICWCNNMGNFSQTSGTIIGNGLRAISVGKSSSKYDSTLRSNGEQNKCFGINSNTAISHKFPPPTHRENGTKWKYRKEWVLHHREACRIHSSPPPKKPTLKELSGRAQIPSANKFFFWKWSTKARKHGHSILWPPDSHLMSCRYLHILLGRRRESQSCLFGGQEKDTVFGKARRTPTDKQKSI